MKTIDLTGNRFGRLTVIGLDRKDKHRYWLCKCDCGNIKAVIHENLTSGRTKSCGCYNLDCLSQRGKLRTGKNGTNWKGGKKKDGKGYLLLHKPNHPSSNANGYIQEHRLIAEKALGRPLKPTECMHHLDENKKRNKNSNLVICNDWGYHQTLHRRSRALKACGDARWRKCPFCKEYDDPKNMVLSFNGHAMHHKDCMTNYQQQYSKKEKANG